MSTRYFVDATGAYLGGFDGAEPPDGAEEVPTAPADARDVWVDGAWSTEDREFDEALAAVESKYSAKAQQLYGNMLTVLFADGAAEESNKASLRQQWAAMQDAKDTEILNLLGG